MATHKHKAVIALGSSVYKNTITQKQVSISKLFSNLSKHKVQKKKDGKYFIFASFRGNVRNAASVDKYYGATIDLDDTSLTLKDIKRKFKKYKHCIYTTHSHKEKGDRYRLILPYKEPLDPPTHVETMLYLMHGMLGADDVDLSSKALSRPMYLPAVHPSRQGTEEFYKNTEGLLFNAKSQKVRDQIATLQFEHAELNTAMDAPFDMNEDVDEGGRNDALARAIGKFIKTGVAVNELMPLAEAWNTSKLSPPLSDKEVKTVVESIVKAHSRNHNDLAWGYDEVLSRIRNSTHITNDYDHILDMIVAGKTRGKFKKSQIELLVLELQKKAKVSKRTIQQELTTKELELAGKAESEADDSFESTTKALRDDFKHWVYVASDDRVYNFKTGEYYKREAFAAMFANPNIEGSLFTLIMKYNLMKKVSRLEFDPAEDETYMRGGVRYANTYIPPEIFPLPGNVDPILNHFKYLIAEPYERNIVLDFIAHLVQHPGVKIRWMPVIKGGKGIGKTIIAEKIILPIIGFTNFGKVNNEVIKSDFNAWQLDKQLVVFEELDIGATQKEKQMLTDRLKSFITDNILTAHRKGLDPYDTINKANSIGFTNVEDAIIISADERRFCMIRTDAKPRKDDYYQKLANWADKHQPEIYNYFLERDISKFSPLRAPETDYTKEVKSLSMNWPGSIINGWTIDSKHPINQAGCVTHTQLVAAIKAESAGRFKVLAEDLQAAGSGQSKNLHTTLRNLGFAKWTNGKSKDGRVSIHGKMTPIWLLPDYVKVLAHVDTKTIKKRVEKIKIIDDNWDE